MDAELFDQIEQAVRREMSAEQRVRIELAARETNAGQAVAALLGEKAVALGKTRLCPICGAGGAVKNGRDRRGLQRFVCRAPGCGHSFTAVTRTWLSGMHLPDKWLAFTESLIGRRSLDWVKENVGISRKTGFAWRKRFLGSAAALPADMLDGIVEADETYFLRSFKGHRGWKRGQPPEDRPPRYRGSGAVKRGLSTEQVPVLTALDRSGHIVQGVLTTRRDEDIVAMLAGQIEAGSVICSDGHSSYPKLAEARFCEHRTIERPVHSPEDKARGLAKGTRGALGLGRVNSYHEGLKTSINRIFRGVSTRFLPNYLALAKHLRGAMPPLAFVQAAIV
jgi:transposase-like protein